MEADIKEIKEDIKEIKEDLAEHMNRTIISENRLEVMEDFVKVQVENQQKNFELMLASNKTNMDSFNKQLNIALGIFAALAILVGAFAKFFI